MPSIPPEILQQILSYFQPRFEINGFDEDHEEHCKDNAIGQLTLSHASRASKHFRRVALPLLYHTIPATSVKLLTTLRQLPKLGELVNAIDLTPTDVYWEDLFLALNSIDRQGLINMDFTQRLELFLKRAVRAPGPDPKDVGVEVVTFLLFLPNLQLLKYESNPISDDLVSIFFDGRAGLVRVPKLRKIAIYDSPRFMDMENPMGVQKALQPTLEEVVRVSAPCNVTQYSPSCNVWWDLDARFQYPNLRSVLLSSVTVHAECIDKLLTQSPNLQSLRIHWPCPRRHVFSVDLGLLGDTLRAHGQNLRELELKQCDEHRQTRSDGRSIGSLQSLTELRTLNIWLDVFESFRSDDPELPLTQALPYSLERLTLFSFQLRAQDVGLEIYKIMYEEWPKLRSIQVGQVLRNVIIPRFEWAAEYAYDKKMTTLTNLKWIV